MKKKESSVWENNPVDIFGFLGGKMDFDNVGDGGLIIQMMNIAFNI